MTVVAFRPRARERERRDRPVVEPSHYDMADLLAKTRAAALPLVDPDGPLPVRFVGASDASWITDNLDALRTLRRARFALDGLRKAGVRGLADVRPCPGREAGAFSVTVVTPGAAQRVHLVTHADRHGQPIAPTSGTARVAVDGHAVAAHSALLVADAATIRASLTSVVMAGLCAEAWKTSARRMGRGVGVRVSLREAIDPRRAVVLEVSGPDDTFVVQVDTTASGAGVQMLGTLRWDRIVPPVLHQERALGAVLGAAGTGTTLVAFTRELYAAAARHLGLVRLAAVP